MLEHVLKIQPLKEFQDWKRGYETYMKKKSNQKLNQLSKSYKMNFTNCKTNKQKVQNFVLPSGGSVRAKNALKFFQSNWKKEYAKSNKVWFYIDDDKSEHSSIHTDILKSAKRILWKVLHQRGNFQNRHYWIS